MPKDIGPLLTVPEFAAELKVKVSTVRRWVYERRINHVKLFKRLIRIPARGRPVEGGGLSRVVETLVGQLTER